MPRFAVLQHDHPFQHWDFLLEAKDALRAWRLHARPDEPGPIAAEALPDHRLAYLDYEGPVSGNRGTVQRWDTGEFVWDVETPGTCAVRLMGGKLSGRAVLRRTGAAMRSDSGGQSTEGQGASSDWEFTFVPDSTKTPSPA